MEIAGGAMLGYWAIGKRQDAEAAAQHDHDREHPRKDRALNEKFRHARGRLRLLRRSSGDRSIVDLVRRDFMSMHDRSRLHALNAGDVRFCRRAARPSLTSH